MKFEPIRGVILKGGHYSDDPRLDRLYEEDWNNLLYPIEDDLPLTAVEKGPRNMTWPVGFWLDQGQEGRCVEFALCHSLLALPHKLPLQFVEMILANKLIYWPAQREDIWPGGSYPGAQPQYEGTSVDSGVKQLVKLGLVGGYDWGLSEASMALGVSYRGPAVIGVNWHREMFNPNSDGYLVPAGGIAGGHAILVFRLDLREDCYWVWNSWDKDWGWNGMAKIKRHHMAQLIDQERGEVVFMRNRKRKPTKTWEMAA